MNKIYRLKFDRKRNELVVVSELMTGAGKDGTTGQVAAPRQGIDRRGRLAGTLTPLALMTGLIVSLLPGMVLAAPALPAGGQIIAGQGSITTQGQQMTIHQQTQHLATNWQSFDIGKNNTVQFVQPDSSAVALNRVTGSSGSQIMGSLKANGQVFILNPNGVLFGRDAKVNVAGLVASTKHLDTADFMRGQYTLSGRGVPGAQVINQGSLTTAEGGFIVLAADRVSNTGRVTTPSGKTVLAAAERVTLQLDNGGLTSVSVSGDVVNALVENRGLLSATDGQVYLTARGKDMLLSTVVNNSGTVEARGLQTDGGVIRLDGGDSGVVRQAGQLLADSAGGRGGDISVEGQNIHLAAGSLTSATGSTGGGRVRVGGGWQGKDQTLRNASGVVMDTTATVDVSATQHGDGGTAVLWAEDYTDFRGTVRATGGAQSGNGGRVETSSHRNLQAFGQVDASAARGQGGEWLLDPTDVTIVGTGTTSGVTESGKGTDASLDVDIDHLFTPSASGAQILNTSIESQLNSGTNVVVQTSGSDVAGQAGNITVSANISKTAGADASLTLKADGNITLTANTGISSTAGKLDISLLGAGSDSGMVNITRSTLNSNGGNITIDQLNHSITGTDGTATVNPNAMTVKIDGGTLNATAGNVTVNAYNPNVNLSQPAYVSTVRNGGAMIQVSGSSTLSGENILLHTTLDGGNAVGLPVFLNGANLTANHDITLKSTLNPVSVITTSSDGAQTTTTTSPSAFSVELRGAGNVLTATAGNITITNNAAGSGNGIFLNGTTASKATLTAGGDITLNGSSVSGYGVGAVNACLTAAGNITVLGNTTSSTGAAITGSSLNATGSLVVTGNSASGAGLQVSGSALAGSRAALTGSSRTGGTGFSLTNTTLAGNLADLASVTLSSQDSGAGAINVLDSKVVTSASRDNLLKKKIENMTTVDMGGTSIFDDTTNATKGWTADYTHADLPNSGWIFSNTTATAAGDISLKGVGFINATLNTTNGGISITSAGNTILTSTTLNATKDVALNAGLNLTLSQVNVTTAGNISLLGAAADSGMVNVTRSTLNSNGGNITIDQLNHSITGTDGTATVNPNAMTVKIDGGTLNATAGNVTVNAYNPNVNLSQPAYVSTVRNGGAMIQVSGSSTLSGENILLHTTLDGGNAVGLPVFLNGANLTANHDITLKSTLNPVSITTTGSDGTETTTTTSPAPASIELRGAGNTLTATAGNINITNNAAGGSNGIFLNGTTASKATLTAGRDITLNGSSASGTGLLITNATLNGSRAALTGSSRTGGTGFSLTNTTLAGNLADLTNVTLSSQGSAAGAINVLDRSVVSDINRDNLLAKKIENMTTVDMNGSAIFDDTDKTDKGWTKDFTSADTPNGGWTFNNTTVTAGGDVSLKGAAFSNSNITVSAGNLTLDNVGSTNLSGSNITVSNGGVSVHSSAGSINANSANVTADRDISLLADKGSVGMWASNATSTNGNI
ncbi:filamentous hemagglutinin N-terminal domain-containing protein, partial [Salmonella enterica]|nr:filamentous hemagglutinin N-terminal domain-containing protein [Salmonella enterica]